MPRKPKKSTSEPEHFELAHQLAEDAIGEPLFQPKRIMIRPPKPLLRRKKVTAKTVRRRGQEVVSEVVAPECVVDVGLTP